MLHITLLILPLINALDDLVEYQNFLQQKPATALNFHRLLSYFPSSFFLTEQAHTKSDIQTQTHTHIHTHGNGDVTGRVLAAYGCHL